MRILRLPVLILFALLACERAGAEDPFDRARRAAERGEVREAAKLFAEAAQTETNGERREDAVLRLANIEWRILRETAAARKRLTDLDTAKAHIELSRIALEVKDDATARAEAERALAAATTKRDKRSATLALARALDGDPRVIPMMRALIASDGPYLEPARLLARAGIRARDGAAALEGINAYYHVSEFNPPPPAIAAAHAKLTAALPKWDGSASPEIAESLAAIRFFDEAALAAPGSELAEFASALRRGQESTFEYYRQIALGKEEPKKLKAGLQREKKYEPLVGRYQGYVTIGKTGSHVDLHMGFIVNDSKLRVEQYGHNADMRFVELDAMVSNGYSEWLNDGESGDGGWANDSGIYQVRPRYADGALRQWGLVFEDDTRAEDVRKTGEETERDRARAKEKAIQHFPGLARRLRRQYLERVASETKSRDAFLARVEQDTFASSILLHEGRHAIDRASGKKYPVWELEYRAKLSEIALAPAPRQALASIARHDVGGNDTHSKANEHLAKGLAAWMDAHRKEIAGYDLTLPPYPQADKLTDAQIVAAVKSLDSMASGAVGS
jgi:hypothetical protein